MRLKIHKIIAFTLIASLAAPPALAQDPTPTPSPTITETGDLEGQKKGAQEAINTASKGQDSAETSRAIYAAMAGVCAVVCLAKITGVAETACVVGAGVAIGADIALAATSKKRFRNAWKELVGGAGAAVVWYGASLTVTQVFGQIYSDSCAAAVTMTALTIAKEFTVQDMRKAQRSAEADLAALNGDGSATQLSLALDDIGDGRVNPVEGNVRGGTVTPAAARPQGGKSPRPSTNAAIACSSFALNKDVSGAVACVNRQGDKIPNEFKSSEFAKAFEKASGSELGQFLKSGVGDGASAESLLKKATANISGFDRSKFADLVAAMNGSMPKGGGGASGRRFASNSDEDRTAVLRNDSADAMRFADPAPIDTTLFGRASAQYMRFTKKKYFEMP